MAGTSQRLPLFFGDAESRKGTSMGGYSRADWLISHRD